MPATWPSFSVVAPKLSSASGPRLGGQLAITRGSGSVFEGVVKGAQDVRRMTAIAIDRNFAGFALDPALYGDMLDLQLGDFLGGTPTRQFERGVGCLRGAQMFGIGQGPAVRPAPGVDAYGRQQQDGPFVFGGEDGDRRDHPSTRWAVS